VVLLTGVYMSLLYESASIRLPEFNVVEHCIGVVLLAHVRVRPSDQKPFRGVVVDLIGHRIGVLIDQAFVDVENQSLDRVPGHVHLRPRLQFEAWCGDGPLPDRRPGFGDQPAVLIEDVNRGARHKVGVVEELNRPDAESKGESLGTVFQVSLAGDVLSDVQVLVESVEEDAVSVSCRNCLWRTVDVDDVRLVEEKVVLDPLHVKTQTVDV